MVGTLEAMNRYFVLCLSCMISLLQWLEQQGVLCSLAAALALGIEQHHLLAACFPRRLWRQWAVVWSITLSAGPLSRAAEWWFVIAIVGVWKRVWRCCREPGMAGHRANTVLGICFPLQAYRSRGFEFPSRVEAPSSSRCTAIGKGCPTPRIVVYAPLPEFLRFPDGGQLVEHIARGPCI